MRASRLRRSDLLLPALLGVVGAVEITVTGYDPTAAAGSRIRLRWEIPERTRKRERVVEMQGLAL